jgi:hypothetical protein
MTNVNREYYLKNREEILIQRKNIILIIGRNNKKTERIRLKNREKVANRQKYMCIREDKKQFILLDKIYINTEEVL